MGYQNTNFKVYLSSFGCEELKLPKQHIVQCRVKHEFGLWPAHFQLPQRGMKTVTLMYIYLPSTHVSHIKIVLVINFLVNLQSLFRGCFELAMITVDILSNSNPLFRRLFLRGATSTSFADTFLLPFWCSLLLISLLISILSRS